MITMTRRETLAGAVALLSEWGAAEVRGRAGITGQRSASGSETAPRLQSAAQPGTSPRAQSGERAGADLVFKHDLPNLTMDDWEVTVSLVDYAPGRVGKVHHHAGFVLAYVLEGMIVTKISGQEEKTYQPGDMFYEPPGSTHEVSRNASETQPAKLLAMIIAKKGIPLTMPGPA
jgi:quercetin dioxygenase-like cupin family protein